MSYSIAVSILDSLMVVGLATGLVLVGWLWRRPRGESKPSESSRPVQVGPYTLADKIGEGAMGEVYRARHAMLRRWCAVKLLSNDVSASSRRRFEKEVQLTAQLSHPNIVSIHDYGCASDGSFYYAMELLDGVTLQELVDRDGPQPAGRVIHILSQLCGALREAHEAGLVHRDIKPANVVLCRQGGSTDVAKLLDFGLVKSVDERESPDKVVGTPLYMSPEAVVSPNAVTARSDLYALGAVAHFLLTGKPVFAGDDVVEVLSKHLRAAPVRASAALGRPIASDLERIVLDCLAKNPLDRPASAASLARRLKDCRDAGSWSEGDADAWWQIPLSAPISSRLDTIASGIQIRANATCDLRACA